MFKRLYISNLYRIRLQGLYTEMKKKHTIRGIYKKKFIRKQNELLMNLFVNLPIFMFFSFQCIGLEEEFDMDSKYLGF